MAIVMAILTLLLLFSFLPSVSSQTMASQFLNKPSRQEPKHFFYDSSGILTMDGTVPGMSDPITLGTGPLPDHCAYKEFYKFTICPLDKQAWKANKRACPNGMYFCYESQLSEHNVRSNFVLQNLEHGDFKLNCDQLGGFKISMHHLPLTDPHGDHDHLYMNVTTSYMHDSYYFHVPKSNCLELWLGSDENLMTSVRTIENPKQLLSPVEVTLNNGQTAGKFYSSSSTNSSQELMEADFKSIPDFNNLKQLDETSHLNLLFLDFRAEHPKLQQMFTVVPEHDKEEDKCNMIVRVRNSMGHTCKAHFKQKNFALRAYTWGNTTYALTIVSGFEQSQTTGSSTSSATEDTRATEDGTQTSDEITNMSGLQTETEKVREVRNETSKTNTKKTEWGVSGSADGTGEAGPIKGGVEGGLGYSQSFGTSETFSETHSRKDSQSMSDYNSQSTAQLVSNAYTKTATISNIASHKTSSSETVGVSSRTVFKWTMTVPPGKVLTPMQMQMNCDGNPVKIPWIKFLLQGEGDEQPVTEYDD